MSNSTLGDVLFNFNEKHNSGAGAYYMAGGTGSAGGCGGSGGCGGGGGCSGGSGGCGGCGGHNAAHNDATEPEKK